MPNVNETVVRYLAAWNERDPKRRRELVAAAWTEEGSYIDAHRHGHGHTAIDAMLAATQVQFPNYRLSLVSGIEARTTISCASPGPPAAPPRRRSIGRRLHGRIACDVRTKSTRRH
jgi:SnoaL-like domain